MLRELLNCLHDELRVGGVTVTRGIAGFGASGRIHASNLLDLSLNLPLVVEFFDAPEKVQVALKRVHDYVGPGHVVTWQARLNIGDD